MLLSKAYLRGKWLVQSTQMFRRVCLRLGALAIPLTAMLACGTGSVSDGTGPVVPVDTTKPPPGGSVQRGTLVVEIGFEAADAPLASAVGLLTSGLAVRLTRYLSTDTTRVATTDGDGRAQFGDLLEGVYTASVDRVLTTSERARLPSDDSDAGVFAGASTLAFAPPQRRITIPLVASRRGSLVISEIFTYRDPGYDPSYGYGTYMEVFNASDTTIFLDGMLVGNTWGGMHSAQVPELPCATFNAVSRLDSLYLHLLNVISFPGTGGSFPILPGEAKVIAMDAMNHAAASPSTNQLNLSQAHFEQHGDDGDIDNPFVPDMVRVFTGTGIFGRGYPVSPGIAYAIMLPGTSDQVVISNLQSVAGSDVRVWRVPKSRIIDVFSTLNVPAKIEATAWYQGGGRICHPWLSSAFERDPSPIGDFSVRMAMRRKSLGYTTSGIELLQRTRTGSRDIEYAEPLRRSLNK